MYLGHPANNREETEDIKQLWPIRIVRKQTFMTSLIYRGSAFCFSQCVYWCSIGSTDMKISSLSLPGCCAPPCILKRGTNVSVTIEFTTDKTFATMTQSLCGEFGACVKLPSLPPDFCKYTTCPVEASKMYSAKVELPVLKTYPPVCINIAIIIRPGNSLTWS